MDKEKKHISKKVWIITGVLAVGIGIAGFYLGKEKEEIYRQLVGIIAKIKL